MTGYFVPLDCPTCGHHLAHRNGTGEGSQALAVAACPGCGAEYVVTVHLRVLPGARAERDRLRKRRYRAGVGA